MYSLEAAILWPLAFILVFSLVLAIFPILKDVQRLLLDEVPLILPRVNPQKLYEREGRQLLASPQRLLEWVGLMREVRAWFQHE